MFWINRSKFFFILLLFCAALLACTTSSLVTGQMQEQQARSADSFIDSIGIVLHLNKTDAAYGNYNDIIKPRLQELGIRHIRDQIVPLEDYATLQKFNDLAAIGIKSTLIVDPRWLKNPASAVTVSKTIANSVEAIEGPNEWNLHPETQYKGKDFPVGLRRFQSELYSAIKRDPSTAHLNVLGPSIGRGRSGKAASKLGRVDCDINNMHSYSGGRIPSFPLRLLIPPGGLMCGAKKPFIATETGFHNAIYNDIKKQSHAGISEQAAAKYLTRMFLEYFNWGIKRAYTYEFIDSRPNPQKDNRERHFGLLRNDGTPKPDYFALKNLIYLLKDSEEIVSMPSLYNSLGYELRGDVTNIHQTLLQKRSGKFYLVLWQEVPSFDLQTKKDLLVPEKMITIVLNTQINQAVVYQPTTSVKPTKQYVNSKKIELMVPDHPVIVEMTPANM